MLRGLEVMGPDEESLGIGRHRGDPRQESIHLLMAHARVHVMFEADLFERIERVASVGAKRLPGSDASPNHRQVIEGLRIVGDFHPSEGRIPEAIGADHEPDHLRFFGSATSPTLDLSAAKEGVVHLDEAGELITAVPLGHGGADLVAHGPGGLIRAHPQQELGLQHGDSVFVVTHQQDQPEPFSKRHPGLVEDRACRQRELVPASFALVQIFTSMVTRS